MHPCVPVVCTLVQLQMAQAGERETGTEIRDTYKYRVLVGIVIVIVHYHINYIHIDSDAYVTFRYL